MRVAIKVHRQDVAAGPSFAASLTCALTSFWGKRVVLETVEAAAAGLGQSVDRSGLLQVADTLRHRVFYIFNLFFGLLATYELMLTKGN